MKIHFLVTAELECTEPESFEPGEFEKKDGKDMGPYLKDKIIATVKESWQHAAKVKKVVINQLAHGI